MAIKEDVKTRSPRGTKNVTQAFFEALDGIPGSQQKAVATAALTSIRDDLKAQRLKTKEAAAKAKAKAKAPAKKKAAATRAVSATKTTKPSATAARKKAASKKAPAKKAVVAKTAKRKSPRKVASPAPEAAAE